MIRADYSRSDRMAELYDELFFDGEATGVEKRIPIDYKRLLAGATSQENIILEPGDMLLFH